MRAYDSIATPLNQMLWKGKFQWTEESRLVSEQLKLALMAPPVLAMLNFQEDFVLECNALKI